MAQKQLADLLDAVVDAASVDSAVTLASAADADLASPPAPRWDTLAKLMRVGSRHLVVLISVSRNRDGTGSVGDAGMLLIAPTAWRSPPRVGDHIGVNTLDTYGPIGPDRDESTRAAADAVITARPEHRRNSSEALSDGAGHDPSSGQTS
jgi:hypothetical protein